MREPIQRVDERLALIQRIDEEQRQRIDEDQRLALQRETGGVIQPIAQDLRVHPRALLVQTRQILNQFPEQDQQLLVSLLLEKLFPQTIQDLFSDAAIAGMLRTLSQVPRDQWNSFSHSAGLLIRYLHMSQHTAFGPAARLKHSDLQEILDTVAAMTPLQRNQSTSTISRWINPEINGTRQLRRDVQAQEFLQIMVRDI